MFLVEKFELHSYLEPYRALDKLYFQKSTVLVHFVKKGVTRDFKEY